MSTQIQAPTTQNKAHIYRSPHPTVQFLPRQSVWSFVFDSRGIDPSIPAYIDAATGRSLTRAQARALTLELAYGLRNLMPFGERVYRGDTVLVFSPNSIAWTVAAYGIIANGARLTPANSNYTARELLHQYTDSHARAMFVHPSLIPVALDMFKQLGVPDAVARKRMIVMEPGYGSPDGLIGMQDLLGKGTLEHEERFDGADSNETFLLCYSSGTTGKPKGVETTHYNYTSELSITDHCFRIYSGKDVILATLPFYHILGINKLMSHPLAVGVPTVVLSKFHPNDFCRSIERFGVTAAVIVPPIVLALTHHAAASNFDIRTLRYLHSAAAPLSQESIEAAIARLAKSGAKVDIGQGFGLTEMSPNSHWTPTAAANDMRGTIGNLQPNLEARLVLSEDDQGNALEEAPVGGPGELWVRGPIVMKGYLNNPTATKNTITKDGWLKTGDIAVVDAQGRWKIVDRKKELIKYKGFQVPPAELEGLLLQHPEIVDAAVIGVEDPRQGTELPRAYVVPRAGVAGAPASFATDIQKWISSKVADHKQLRGGVVLIDVVPKSQAGKILRKELREKAKVEFAAKSKL